MSTFGEWLQAQRVGCSVAMLRKIETDDRRPSAQIAGLLAAALEPDRAVWWLAAAQVLRAAIGAPLPPVEQAGYERFRGAVHAKLGEKVFARAWSDARGRLLQGGCRGRAGVGQKAISYQPSAKVKNSTRTDTDYAE